MPIIIAPSKARTVTAPTIVGTHFYRNSGDTNTRVNIVNSGVTQGDLVLVIAMSTGVALSDPAAGDPSTWTPSDWTRISEVSNEGDETCSVAWWKIMGASPDSFFNMNDAGDGSLGWFSIAIRGAHATNPIIADNHFHPTTSNNPNPPEIVVEGECIVVLGGVQEADGGSVTSITGPISSIDGGSYTLYGGTSISGGVYYQESTQIYCFASKTISSPGTEDPSLFDFDLQDACGAHIVAIRPPL